LTKYCVSKLKGRKLENQKKKVCIVSFFGMVYKHCMIYALSFESKIRKNLSKFPSVKVSDDDTIKENFLD
jgi:hypothetical protein